MDGAKPSFILATEIYAGIGIAKAPLAVDALRGGRKCQSWRTHRPSSWPPDYIALWNRDRQLEPAGRAQRAAIDPKQCRAQLSRTRSRRAGFA